MKILCTKLGLPETASEAEALAALAVHTDLQRELLALTGAPSPAAALGAVRGWKDGAASATELKARLDGIQKAKDDDERASITSKLRDLGYTKAQVEKLAGEMTLDGLRGYASVATPQTMRQEHREPSEGTVAVVSLSPEDRVMAEQLGLSEDAYAAHKAALKGRKETR